MSIITSSAFINFTNGTPRADKIIATSNIGIGTNAPAYELDVVGNANVYSINTNSLYLEDFIISSSHGLDHVTNENNSTGDTIISTNATTGFQASSNIVVGGDINLTGNIYQNGTIFTGGSGGIDTTQTLALSNVTTGLTVSSNAVVTGNVTAGSFIGDGSQLTGVGIDTTQTLTLSNVTTGLQASSNIVVGGDINLTGNIYQNGTIFTGGGSSLWSESGSDIYYNSGNVGISNAAPAHTLSIGSNLYVDDVGSNVLVVGGNVSVSNVITAQRLKLNNVSVLTNQDFQQITNVGNVTTNTVEFTNPTTSLVASGNVEVGGNFYAPGVPVQVVADIVNGTYTYSTSTTGYYIPPLDINITPKFSNSKIILHWTINCEADHNTVFRIYRSGTLIGYNNTSSTDIWSGVATPGYDQNQSSTPQNIVLSWVDTPGTTSALNYQIFIQATWTGGSIPFYLNRTYANAGNYNELTVSYKSAMELAV